MIVCSCNVFSDDEVRACATPGPGCPRTAAQVYRCLGCRAQCGRCAPTIRSILSDCAPSGCEASGSCAPDCTSKARCKAGSELMSWQTDGSLASLSPAPLLASSTHGADRRAARSSSRT